MQRIGKSFSLMILAFCFLIGQMDASAQSKSGEGVQIIANPKGTIVRIDGEYGIAGSAPYTIGQNFDGVYRIKATYPGFENYSSKFHFKPGVNQRISIRLTQKTRARAFLRSFFVPGWGQSYTDQKTKSYFIRATALGALTYLIVHEVRYQDAVNEFEVAAQNYEANTSGGAQADALAKVQSAQAIVDRRYERRRTALIIAGSVYLYNVLDALFFFPDFDVAGLKFSLKPNMQESSFKLGFSARL